MCSRSNADRHRGATVGGSPGTATLRVSGGVSKGRRWLWELPLSQVQGTGSHGRRRSGKSGKLVHLCLAHCVHVYSSSARFHRAALLTGAVQRLILRCLARRGGYFFALLQPSRDKRLSFSFFGAASAARPGKAVAFVSNPALEWSGGKKPATSLAVCLAAVGSHCACWRATSVPWQGALA